MGYGAVALLSVLPLIATILGTLLATVFGCNANGLNEGLAPDCPGGDIVYMLFVFSWYALVTLPLGAALFAFLGSFTSSPGIAGNDRQLEQ